MKKNQRKCVETIEKLNEMFHDSFVFVSFIANVNIIIVKNFRLKKFSSNEKNENFSMILNHIFDIDIAFLFVAIVQIFEKKTMQKNKIIINKILNKQIEKKKFVQI